MLKIGEHGVQTPKDLADFSADVAKCRIVH